MTEMKPASSELGLQEAMASPLELPNSLSAEQRGELSQQKEARHDWIEQLGAQDRHQTSRRYRRLTDLKGGILARRLSSSTIGPSKTRFRSGSRFSNAVNSGNKTRFSCSNSGQK